MKDRSLVLAHRSNTTLRNGIAIHGNELGYGVGQWIYRLAQYVQSWFYQPPVFEPINYTKWHKDLMYLFGQKLTHAKNISPKKIAEIFYQCAQELPQFEKENLPRAHKDMYRQLMQKFGHRPELLDAVVRLTPEIQKFHCIKKLAQFKRAFPGFFTSSKTYDEVADYINSFLDEFSSYAEAHKVSTTKSVFDALKDQLVQLHPDRWKWEMGRYVARIPSFTHMHTPTMFGYLPGAVWSQVGVKKPTTSEDAATLASIAEKTIFHRALPYGERFDSPLGKRISENAKAKIDAVTQQVCDNIVPCDAAAVQYVDHVYPDFVKAMFGGDEVGARVITTLPVLDVANSDGMTGYIDYIHPRQMTHPVMRGVDSFDRPFIALCHSTADENEEVEVIFQRYTHDPHNWKSGSLDGLTRVFRHHGTLFKEDVNYAHRLFKGEPVGIRNINMVEGPQTNEEGKSALRLCGRLL